MPPCALALLSLSLLFLVLLTVPVTAHAQVPDTTRTDTLQAPPDSLQMPPDSLRRLNPADSTANRQEPLDPLPFLHPARGAPVLDRLPIHYPATNVAQLLAYAPGTFLYDLGAVGWPHGWSWRSLAPQRPALLFDGHPYINPVTGSPQFELLPPAFLRAPRVGVDRLGGPVAVYTQPRFYDVKRPLTVLRYRRDNTSMQSIAAAHIQQRRIGFMGDPGLLQIVGGYYGRAADNEYPNSDLRRERRLLGRLHYRQSRWSVTLRNLHSRRKIGAHGGVIPQQNAFITVYNRPIADVRHPEARRQTIRNDLALTVRGPLLPGLDAPLTASVNWAAQTFRYYNPDTVQVKSNSFSSYVRQDLAFGAQHLSLELSGSLDRVRFTNAWAGSARRIRLHATARDSMALGATTVLLDGGLHATDGQLLPSGTLRLTRQWGSTRLFAEARLATTRRSWIETQGFGPFVQPLPDASPASRLLTARLGLVTGWRTFDVRLSGYAHELRHPVDLYATATPDSLVAQMSPAPFQRAGATLALGWRRNATAGLYATAQGTAQHFLNPHAAPENARVADTLPALFGRARLGARFVAFEGDLDADLYVQGRGWTELRSRIFHPPTGRLAIPPANAPVMENVPLTFGPSGTLDVVLEAGIRTATLFLSFENVLSGTALQPGTLIVPVYPLAEQRFRLGVFWPIDG